MKKDYSEYQYTEYDKYLAQRTAPHGVTLPFFINHVRFDQDEKSIIIEVDSYWESISMQDEIEEYEKEVAERDGRDYEKMDNQAENEEEIDLMEDCKRRLDEMRKKYNYSQNYIDGFPYEDPDLLTEPLINVFSGAGIKLNYGEGILDFIYADFVTPLRNQIRFLNLEEKLVEYLRTTDEFQATEHQPTEFENKIYNERQEIVEDFFDYVTSFSELNDILYSSLYSAICPPVIKGSLPDKRKMLIWYGNYLLGLQKEYKEMIEFCYDEEFYPGLFGKLYPNERLHLYRRLRDIPTKIERKEDVVLSKFRPSGRIRPYGIPVEDLINLFENMDLTPTEEAKRFSEKYGISVDSLMAETKTPTFLNIGYRARTVEEMLELEFSKMLEQDVRFRKCKRCGKYFIMKGNYDTKYCSRIAEGETRSCQELAAIDNYKAKIADDKAIPIYNRYYKRYAARVKVHQIKEEDFKKWKYQAMDKRNQCSDGIITPEEYTEWMEASFPNRKKKHYDQA